MQVSCKDDIAGTNLIYVPISCTASMMIPEIKKQACDMLCKKSLRMVGKDMPSVAVHRVASSANICKCFKAGLRFNRTDQERCVIMYMSIKCFSFIIHFCQSVKQLIKNDV